MAAARSIALLLALGCVCLVLPMLLRSFTDSLLFYPERGQWRTPAALGLPYEEIWLEVGDDRIQAWWVAPDAPGPIIVMFHGNGGTIADRLENVAELHRRFDASVVQLEYPGYGDSGGRPSEASLYAAGEAVCEEAERRAGGRPVVLFGRSLGGAVAIDLAAADRPVAGLVVESTFTSLADMAQTTGIPLARRLVAYEFDSLKKIRGVRAPLLLVHGDRDEIVPYEMAHRLYEAASGASRKTLHTVEGGSHNDTWILGGAAYWSAWAEFLGAIAGSRAP